MNKTLGELWMAGEIPQSEAIELLVIENAKLVKEIAELKAAIKLYEDNVSLKLYDGVLTDHCEQCNSNNTYISPNGYNTVLVCNDCHYEQHYPWAEVDED